MVHPIHVLRPGGSVDATLYLKGSVLCWVKDFIEGLLRRRKRSCEIAGSAESR